MKYLIAAARVCRTAIGEDLYPAKNVMWQSHGQTNIVGTVATF